MVVLERRHRAQQMPRADEGKRELSSRGWGAQWLLKVPRRTECTKDRAVRDALLRMKQEPRKVDPLVLWLEATSQCWNELMRSPESPGNSVMEVQITAADFRHWQASIDWPAHQCWRKLALELEQRMLPACSNGRGDGSVWVALSRRLAY